MFKLRVVAVLLAASLPAANDVRAQAPTCAPLAHVGAGYTVCEVDLRRHMVRLYWKRPSGAPYGFLRALPPSLLPGSGRLLFASNAGMFDPSFKPAGLYIEEGRQLVPANTKPGYGNFHMRPNGVFYVAGDRAGVLDTLTYLKVRPHADLATQSGPMLVLNGKLHPRFDRNSTSLKVRSGVGVRDAQTIFFAISDGEVSFAAFAELFRERLGCANALFLDGGSAASLYAPALRRGGNLLSLGPMLGVFEKPSAAGAN